MALLLLNLVFTSFAQAAFKWGLLGLTQKPTTIIANGLPIELSGSIGGFVPGIYVSHDNFSGNFTINNKQDKNDSINISSATTDGTITESKSNITTIGVAANYRIELEPSLFFTLGTRYESTNGKAEFNVTGYTNLTKDASNPTISKYYITGSTLDFNVGFEKKLTNHITLIFETAALSISNHKSAITEYTVNSVDKRSTIESEFKTDTTDFFKYGRIGLAYTF